MRAVDYNIIFHIVYNRVTMKLVAVQICMFAHDSSLPAKGAPYLRM
jgi:hypothetical protein